MAEEDVLSFYDGFASDYELAYEGAWDEAVARHGAAIDDLVRARVPHARDVLDCACGIGTQAIGLALRGYRVRGTDLSERSLERAAVEAARLGATVELGRADFRDLSGVEGTFDAVLCCDNALPHMLEPADLVRALAEMRSKLRPGGVLVATLRDFGRALRERPPLAPTVVVPGPPRRVLVRMHDWDAERPEYVVRYLVLTEREQGWDTRELAMRYRALTKAEAIAAAREAGFEHVEWLGAGDVDGIAQCALVATAS